MQVQFYPIIEELGKENLLRPRMVADDGGQNP